MWPRPRKTLLRAHLDKPPIVPHTYKSKYTTTQRRIPCEHDRCKLYTAANLSRGSIIGRVLFYPVCKILNHASKHTCYIEWELRSYPRLWTSLSKLTYIPVTQTTVTTIKSQLTTLREHPVDCITSILDNLRSQHSHFITTGKLDWDPN